MANVKNRFKTPKSAITKNRHKEKKLSTGIDDTSPSKVMKNRKCLNSDALTNLNSNKHSLPIIKSCFVTKSGHIRKSKKNLKHLDIILKSELMIDDKINNGNLKSFNKKELKPQKRTANGVNNNNNCISDQNKNISADLNPNCSKKNAKTDLKKNKVNHTSVKKLVKPKTCNEFKHNLTNISTFFPFKTLLVFECDYCQKKFSSKYSLKRHIIMHLGLKIWSCCHCQKHFSQRCNLTEHLSKKHPADDVKKPEIFVCEICESAFHFKENLIVHLESHVNNEPEYKCSLCDKVFSYQLLLTQHEKQHLVTGPYKCSICNMSYSCRSKLSFHLASHLKIKNFTCQYCGKKFLRSNSNKRHIQICHGGHRLQCPICYKKLKGHLSEHMRTHDKKRPHECQVCGQRFTQSTQLTVHRRSHTGARPYPCRICGRPFSHSNALMLHIRRHTGEKPFPCAMCPMSFSQLPHMKAHMRKIHGKENPYRCEKCNQFFKLKVHIENHAKLCSVRQESVLENSQPVDEKYDVVGSMSLSRMRFLLALLLTMIASQEKLRYLGFNKRLIDDLLAESLEAMGHSPCRDANLTPYNRLKTNIQILLNGTIPKEQMEKFKSENKTTEDLLELLTDEKKEEY